MIPLGLEFIVRTTQNSRPTCYITVTHDDEGTIKAFERSDRLCGPGGLCAPRFIWHNGYRTVLRVLISVNEIGDPQYIDVLDVQLGPHFPVKGFRSADFSGKECVFEQDHSQCVAADTGDDGFEWHILVNMNVLARGDRPRNTQEGILALFQLAPLSSLQTFGKVLIEEHDKEESKQVQEQNEQVESSRNRQNGGDMPPPHSNYIKLNPINNRSARHDGDEPPPTSDYISSINNRSASDRSNASWHSNYIAAKRQICDYCKHTGHSQDECNLRNKLDAVRCTYESCGKIGHTEDECRVKERDRAAKRAKDAKRRGTPDTCEHCNHVGHNKNKCKMLDQPDLPRCTYEHCRKLGHTEDECRLKARHGDGGGAEHKENVGGDKGKGRRL